MSKNYYQKLIPFLLIAALISGLAGVFSFSKLKSVEAQIATEIRKPTAHADSVGATTDPDFAYDLTNGTTFATTDYSKAADPSVIFNAWQTTIRTYTSLVLNYRYHADAAENDTYAVAYSINGGSSWIDLISSTSAGAVDTTISVDLSSNQDLSLLQVKIYTSKTGKPDKKNLYTRDIWTEGDYEEVPVPAVITVSTTGTQTASMNIPSTNNYIGGPFTFVRDTGIIDVTQIVITETGTVNANLNLSNLKLYYETSATCSYEGTETLFGIAASFDASEKATVLGTMPVGTSQVCLYLVLDVGSGSLDDQTLETEISNPSTEVIVSEGTVSPITPIATSGTTSLTTVISPATWKAAEDTPIISVNKNENIRLRIQITNIGGEAADYDYLIEYALKIGDLCGDDENFIAVPVIASTEHFETTDSIYITNRQPTNVRLTVSDSYTFVPGKVVEDPSNSSGNVTLSFENYTEIEFVFQANNNATDEGNYCFRVTKAGIILEGYPVYPELQIISAP